MKSISVLSRAIIVTGVVATIFLLVRNRMSFDDVETLYHVSKYRVGYSRKHGFEHHTSHYQ